MHCLHLFIWFCPVFKWVFSLIIILRKARASVVVLGLFIIEKFNYYILYLEVGTGIHFQTLWLCLKISSQFGLSCEIHIHYWKLAPSPFFLCPGSKKSSLNQIGIKDMKPVIMSRLTTLTRINCFLLLLP
jgi:hypothetical protein